MPEKLPEKEIPDRPLECSECKKNIAICYTEIVGKNITHTRMCADCPELQRRLHGTNPKELLRNQVGVGAALECGNCGTTLEEVKRGHPVGCSECYNVFGDVLLLDMQSTHHISPKISPFKKGSPIHIGRVPGESLAINPSARLVALNEALVETLKREDYEQAAWLRDQIKEITDHQPQEKKPTEGKENEPPKQQQ